MAQPGSAPAWHAGGQGFESPWIHISGPMAGKVKGTIHADGSFFFARICAHCATSPDQDRPLWPRWGIVPRCATDEESRNGRFTRGPVTFDEGADYG
jgi:hypothetical protein